MDKTVSVTGYLRYWNMDGITYIFSVKMKLSITTESRNIFCLFIYATSDWILVVVNSSVLNAVPYLVYNTVTTKYWEDVLNATQETNEHPVIPWTCLMKLLFMLRVLTHKVMATSSPTSVALKAQSSIISQKVTIQWPSKRSKCSCDSITLWLLFFYSL